MEETINEQTPSAELEKAEREVEKTPSAELEKAEREVEKTPSAELDEHAEHKIALNANKAALKSIIDKWAQEHLDENGFVKAGQEDLAVLETQMEENAAAEREKATAIFQDQMRAKIAKETRDAIAPSPRTKKTNFISPEDIAHMKDMRMQGASQMEIARKFGVSLTTIRYHLIADVADDLKERGKEYSRELLIDPAKKKAYVERQRAYAKKKYAEDPEWRKRITETNKRWLAKKKAEKLEISKNTELAIEAENKKWLEEKKVEEIRVRNWNIPLDRPTKVTEEDINRNLSNIDNEAPLDMPLAILNGEFKAEYDKGTNRALRKIDKKYNETITDGNKNNEQQYIGKI